jgi:hypothetical protein
MPAAQTWIDDTATTCGSQERERRHPRLREHLATPRVSFSNYGDDDDVDGLGGHVTTGMYVRYMCVHMHMQKGKKKKKKTRDKNWLEHKECLVVMCGLRGLQTRDLPNNQWWVRFKWGQLDLGASGSDRRDNSKTLLRARVHTTKIQHLYHQTHILLFLSLAAPPANPGLPVTFLFPLHPPSSYTASTDDIQYPDPRAGIHSKYLLHRQKATLTLRR